MGNLTPKKIIASEAHIRQRIDELAQQINADYLGHTLDVVCLINGASAFCADLVRKLTMPVRIHSLGFSSYPQGNTTGEICITSDIREPLNGKHVLVMEGIIISGRTPRYILDMLNLRRPASLALCALGMKPAQLSVELPLKYIGFELGSEIAVGYGVGSENEKVISHLVEK